MKIDIINHVGMKNLKEVLSEWKNLSINQKKLGFRFVLPNYFLIINPEIAEEEVISLISNICEEEQLIDFSSSLKSYLFNLSYSSDDIESFDSFKELYEIYFTNLCKHKESFRGVISIDITEWIEYEQCSSKKFLAFLDFMATIDKETLAIFISHSSNKIKNDLAFKQLLTKTRIRSLEIGEITDDEGYSYLLNILNKSGFTVSDESSESLKKIVSFILSIEGNEGLRSLSQIADEIMYDILSKAELDLVINNTILEKYSSESEWAKTFKASRKKYLGFNV